MKPPPVPPAANPADFGKPGISRVLRGRTPAPSLLRRAAGVEDAVAALAAVLLPDGMKSRVVKTPDGDKAVIHRSWFKHIVDRRDIAGNRDPRERFAEWIIPTLRSPDEIWLVGDRKRFIKVFLNQEKGDQPMLLVLNERPDGFLLWTAYRVGRKRINNQRSGTLLYSRELAEEKEDG